VAKNRKDWEDKLTDALWAYHTTFKTLLCMLPYKVVYGHPCYLPVVLEYQA